MKTELAVTQKETQLAHSPEFSSEQVRLLGQTVAKDCNQDELAFFLNVCKLKRLDPFTGQVHCVKRWDSTLGAKKMSIQVGIDGFRVIAARSNELAGISEPEFDTRRGASEMGARHGVPLRPRQREDSVHCKGPLQRVCPDEAGRNAESYVGDEALHHAREMRRSSCSQEGFP